MKPFTTFAAVFFALGAFGHLLRIIWGWKVVIGTWIVPGWASPVVVVIAAGLSLMLFREARQ